MPGELITSLAGHASMSEMYDAGRTGLTHTKAIALGGLTVGGSLVARKMITNSTSSGNRRPHFVKQNHAGLRHRKGVYTDEIVRPNRLMYLLNPFKGYDQVNLRDDVLELRAFKVRSKEGVRHLIESELTWGHIADDGEGNTAYDMPYHTILEKALTGARTETDVKAAVAGICIDGLRKLLTGQNSEDIDEVNSDMLQEDLISRCGGVLLDSYGAEIRRLNILSSASAVMQIEHSRSDGIELTPEEVHEFGASTVEHLAQGGETYE